MALGRRNVILGTGSTSDFNECVVIGVGLKTTRDRQLLVGNREVRLSKILSDDQFERLYALLTEAIGVPRI